MFLEAGRYGSVIIEASACTMIDVENVNFRIRSIVLPHACEWLGFTCHRIFLYTLSWLSLQGQLSEEITWTLLNRDVSWVLAQTCAIEIPCIFTNSKHPVWVFLAVAWWKCLHDLRLLWFQIVLSIVTAINWERLFLAFKKVSLVKSDESVFCLVSGDLGNGLFARLLVNLSLIYGNRRSFSGGVVFGFSSANYLWD